MTLPNFLIIGAAKSGTTALYRYLEQHPSVFMSKMKEPHYFSYTESTKFTPGPNTSIHNAITDLSEYTQLFDAVSNEIAIGEASPTYLYIPESASRIKALIPNAKLIAILRNPVDRAYSAYAHLMLKGQEPLSEFSQALAAEKERIKLGWGPIYHYIACGKYGEQIKNIYSHFPVEQVHIIIYDDFLNHPLNIIQGIYSFLGIDPNFVPSFKTKPLRSGKPKSEFVQKIFNSLFTTDNPFRTLARAVIKEKYRWKATSYLRNQNLETQSVDPNLRASLIPEFLEDIKTLEKLIRRDLTIWLK